MRIQSNSASAKFKLNLSATSIRKVSSHVSTLQLCNHFSKSMPNVGKKIQNSWECNQILQMQSLSSIGVQQAFGKSGFNFTILQLFQWQCTEESSIVIILE